MTDKELIKKEIERLKNEQLFIFSKGENEEICGTALTCIGVYNQLLSFINSLPEESTSEDTCLLGHDYKNRDCENCSFELCKRFSKPVSEDLEIEIENYINRNFSEGYDGGMLSDSEPNLGGVTYCDLANLARHFAEWQKNQMKETLQIEYEKGRFDMREEIMKDAVEAEVFVDYNINFGYGSLTANIDLDEQHLKKGDKVKIIIVKEEKK